jgi:hypothetical protein
MRNRDVRSPAKVNAAVHYAIASMFAMTAIQTV